eukprot:1054683-Rhodomonas_salina.2
MSPPRIRLVVEVACGRFTSVKLADKVVLSGDSSLSDVITTVPPLSTFHEHTSKNQPSSGLTRHGRLP